MVSQVADSRVRLKRWCNLDSDVEFFLRNLGIDRDSGDVYIGSRDRLLETPQKLSVFPVRVYRDSPETFEGPEVDSFSISEYVFQELSFDSVSQIRRGYIWRRMESHNQRWGREPFGLDLITYQYQGFLGIMRGKLPSQVLFTFGSQVNFTVGELVHYEPDATGQELLTIKMRPQFGLMPRLKPGALERSEVEVVESALQDIVSGYRSSPPASVIDRCRDALTIFLSMELKQSGKDLGKLVSEFDERKGVKRSVVSGLAHTVNRLHSRAKPAETRFPPVSDRQAELAVGAVAEVLVSLGWAEWSHA